MLPEEFTRRVHAIYGESVAAEVIEFLSVPRKISIRINTLTSSDKEVIAALTAAGASYSPVPGIQHAYIVHQLTTRDLTELPEYMNGAFYIQNASSMVPAVVLDAAADDAVLDLAAAPGSKTTHIAALMQNNGTIVANDISRERMYKLEAILKRYGIRNCRTIRMRGEAVWQKYPEHFDKVLVDVPCSMEGTFCTDDASTYESWSVKHIKKLSSQQKWMLRGAVSATKPGGIIVYSTCTMAPEENEEVIDWILSKENGKVEIEPIEVQGIPTAAPLSSWKGKPFVHDMRGVLRVVPGDLFEGFFIARLKKKESTIPSSMRPDGV